MLRWNNTSSEQGYCLQGPNGMEDQLTEEDRKTLYIAFLENEHSRLLSENAHLTVAATERALRSCVNRLCARYRCDGIDPRTGRINRSKSEPEPEPAEPAP